ncbi:MAG TPA: glycosyltransferase family 4 protein [Dissulfurispiraceae bacterium]|nr:glycosyltransferase family 4 protein [Dissulfurispiraceae bacterium]
MKILHLLYESMGDPFGFGGAGARAYEIYSRIRERHDITLLCRRYPGARDGEIAGLSHIFAGRESASFTVTLLSFALGANRFVKERGKTFDVIIQEFSPAVPTFLHCFIERPVVLQIQGYTGRLYFRKYNPVYASVLSFLESVMPRFYRTIIFLSGENAGNYRVRHDARVVIIPNGIDGSLLETSPVENPYILYLGRIDVYGKGLDLLIDAFREYGQSFPGTELVIAGDGRDRRRFEALVEQLPQPMRNSTRLLGWVTGQDKREALRKAMFAVFPSRHEVQPLALLEAMACGKAVVVSDIAGHQCATESGAGTAFLSGDASSLARAMKEMTERQDRAEMGEKGRDYAGQFTWDAISQQYEEFLQSVVRDAGSRG